MAHWRDVPEGHYLPVMQQKQKKQKHRGIEQTVTMNSSVRQFFAAPSKTANSKAVSITRADVMLCELIVEQNIPLAKSDDTLSNESNETKSKIL